MLLHEPPDISIHALREEGDIWLKSVRCFSQISIHALREEGDAIAVQHILERDAHFYPRPPRGGRRETPHRTPQAQAISIHALREEGDSH